MADIFKLMGRIVIDASGADTDIDKITNKAQTAGKKIKASFDKIEKAFKTTTKSIDAMGKALIKVGDTTERVGRTMARGITIGVTAFSSAAVVIGKNALDIRSSIEQGLGGTEAVFKQYAHIIKDESKDAWKNAGLSMEEYLATANKMGSLFKGAGFGEMQAAEMTVNAMQRAADVASIMGIDVSVAMEAIAGAAKGNFTMMDNLGVAMNDTTLEAYRLEKGFDKAVSQMTTAEKVELAMQMFMERTADYTGNYAKENETAAGSLQTLKAAWSNFLGGVGTFEDLEQSAFGYLRIAAKTMGLDSLVPMINGAQETVQRVAEILSMEGLDGRQKFAQIRRYLLEKSVNLANALGEKIPKGISNAATVISETLSDINVNLPHYLDVGRKIFEAVRDGVKQTANSLTETAAIVAPDVISGWFTAKTDFIQIGLDFLGAISESIEEDLNSPDSQVGEALKNGLHTVLTGLSENLPNMVGFATSFLDSIADALTSEGEDGKTISEKAGDIIGGIVGELNEWINDGGVGKFTEAATSFLLGLGAELVRLAPSILSGFVQGIWSGLSGVMSSVTKFFSDDDMKRIYEMQESLEGVERVFRETERTLDAAVTAYSTSMDNLDARLSIAEGHLQAIAELENAATLTPEEYSEWQRLVTDLVALYPELGKYVDEETGLFTENTNAIRNYIIELDNLARRKALQKIQAEFEDEWADASKALVEAHIIKEKAREEYEKWRVPYEHFNNTLQSGDYSSVSSDVADMMAAYLPDMGFHNYYALDRETGRYNLKVDPYGVDMTNVWRSWAEQLQPKRDESYKTWQDAEALYAEIEAGMHQMKADMLELTNTFNVVFPDVKNLGTKSGETADDISGLGTATDNLEGKFNDFSLPSYGDENGAGFATGYSFVPRDNLPAYLHQGEAVLTAKEASEWRQYKNGGTYRLEMAVNNLISAISGINGDTNTNMNLYINKRHVASAMSRDMGRSIGNREYMLMRGMGG